MSGEIGVGAGIIVGGELFRGSQGFGGEFGHMTIDANGRPCACGSRGCLETLAGLEPLLELAGLDPASAATTTGSGAPVAELATRARMGDQQALGALREAGHWLGIGIASAANLLNFQAVVLGGFFAQLATWLAASDRARARDARARLRVGRPAAAAVDARARGGGARGRRAVAPARADRPRVGRDCVGTTLSEVMAQQLGNRPCGGRYGDIVQAIGNTPLVELKRLSPKPGVRIWAKLESHNPTGSVKDRVARSMIESAEEQGAIAPGQTILEPTSGNTGISLAMICARKGYPLRVVMPDNVTPERTQLLKMYGADIVYSEGSKGSNGAVELALQMAESDASYYMPYQYGNEANPRAHYEGTAPEILEELDEVTAFVAGLGTGGTLMGNGRRLREELGDSVKIVAAEPMQGEPVQGLRSLDDGFIPPIIDLSLLDRKIFVTNHDAIVWTRRLLDEEGIFAGVSSGAIASIAVRIAGELDEGNVVFIVCDDGWKYLSSGVYTLPVEEIENLDSTVWW